MYYNSRVDAFMVLQVRTEDAGPPEEPLDSYVMVEKDDVLDAIGTFVAAYLAELPEAQNLQPKELQVAIKHAFKVGITASVLGTCILSLRLPFFCMKRGRLSAVSLTFSAWHC